RLLLPSTHFRFSQSCLPVLLFFFFYCYGDHRDLHSFPTRRSSDLVFGVVFSTRVESALPGLLPPGVDAAADTSQLLQSPEQIRLDRKSTRLNSSHVKISYAVFCLKKKKKKKKEKKRQQMSSYSKTW